MLTGNSAECQLRALIEILAPFSYLGEENTQLGS